MTRGRILAAGALAAITLTLAWLLFVVLPKRAAPSTPAAAAAPGGSTGAAAEGGERRKIKARLFYVAESGTRLTTIEQDIAYRESTVEQAKEILAAQLAPAAGPLLSAVPSGTRLRALFVTPEGEAFVDLSGELVSGHPGGSMNELLTIHTIVQALTSNLPGISAVQILVDGKEVDTLAGHVDLRKPLPGAPEWAEDSPQPTAVAVKP